ncbi:portal vertex of head protein [Rhizobium phage RHph_I1_18]|nr:portal vertex of head protein [Rhizobium phage RHph_I1_18]
MQLFGFDLFIKKDPQRDLKAIAPDPIDDGALTVDIGQGSASYTVGDSFAYTTTFDFDADAIQEQALIAKYREISTVAEVESAIDDIINEFVSTDKNDLVDIDLDELPYSDAVKNKIVTEFQYVLKLLDFNNRAYEIIRRWYVDGRMYYNIVVDPETAAKVGISKLVYIDPRLLKKVRVVKSDTDPQTKVTLYNNVDEFYMFSETGFTTASPSTTNTEGVKITSDSIASVTSGILNSTNRIVLSFLHKAIRPLNLLKSLEDASVIYRLSRAPERRIFYIDVGNLPPAKAEQAMRKQMQQFKTKAVFDAQTGLVKTDAKHMTMVEDYWLPRNASGRATEITTLPSGQNLGEMEEVNYMLQKLYKALNVPVSRLDSQSGFMFGRVTEISRDEVKFMKFIARLRRRFSGLFIDLLRKQLVLKGIMTSTEFDNIKQYISFEFTSDNTFDESLQNEVMSGRLGVLAQITDFEGVYFSKAYIWREVLHLSQEDIDQMQQEIDAEGGPKDELLDASRGRVDPIDDTQIVPPGGGSGGNPSTGKSAAAKPAINNSSREKTNGKPSSLTTQRSTRTQSSSV